MRNSKFLLTSLLAAATMSATAYAWTTGADGLPDTSGIIQSTETTIAADHTVTADTIYDFKDSGEASSVSVTLSNSADVKLVANAADSMMVVSSITGDGDVWFAKGRWKITSSTNFTSGTIFVQGGQIWISGGSAASNPTVFNNDFVLGTSSTTAGEEAFRNSSIRVNDNIKLAGQATILNSGTTISFQNGQGITFSNLTGSGAIATSAYGGSASKLTISDANNFTGTIDLATSITLDWSSSSSSATFGGLSGSGKVAGGSYLNIKDAQDTTFSGTVGAADSRVALALSGTGSQSFTGTNYFSSVSVADTASLTLGGTTTVSNATTISGGSLTTAGTTTFSGVVAVTGGSLTLGGTVTLANAIQNSGTVTISDTTVFNLTQTGETTLVSNIDSGAISGVDWSSLTNSNFTYNGAAITVGRGLTSTADGVVSYDASAVAKTLTWNGDGSAVWKAVTITETSPSKPWLEGSTAEAFYNGDSVTFSTADASVEVSGTVKPAALTVSENTTFKGTDATISVAKDSLTISGSATLGIDSGVTLDLGSDSDAIGSSASPLALSGSGTVKYTFTGGDGGGSGIFIADSFTGIVDYYGNLNWIDYGGSSTTASSVADSATIRLSKTSSQTKASLWSYAPVTFKNAFVFGSDYEITTKNGGSMTFEGSVDASGKTLTIDEGTNPVTFKGTTTMDKIVNNGKTRVESSAFTITGTGTDDNGSLNWGTFEIGAGSSVNVTADFKASAWSDGSQGAKTLTLEEGATLSVGGIIRNAAGLTLNNGGLITTSEFQYMSGAGWGVNAVSGNGYIVADSFVVGNRTQLVFENNHFVIGNFRTAWNGNAQEIRLGNATFGAKQDWSTNNAFTLTGAKTDEVPADDAATTTVFNTGAFDAESKTFSETSGHTIMLGGVLSGKGGLKKAGAGTLTLSGDNAYTGGTVIEAGTVVAAHANALGTTKGVEVKSGATLNLGASAVTVAGLSGAGTVDLASGTDSATLTVNGGGVFTGTLSRVSLVKQGADSTLELSNAGNWISSATVEAGTLRIAPGTVGDYSYVSITSVSVSDGAKLEIAPNLSASVSMGLNAMSGVTFAAGASLIVDATGAAENDVLKIITSSVIKFNTGSEDVSLTSDNLDLFVNDFVTLKGWEGLADWSYDGSALSVTLTIPEPSVFGLLAGLGALALAGTRRRRKKA